jgi:hypothetical protein
VALWRPRAGLDIAYGTFRCGSVAFPTLKSECEWRLYSVAADSR